MKRRSLIAVTALTLGTLLAVASGKKTDQPDDPFSTPVPRTAPERPGRPARASAGLPYPACPAPRGVIHRRDLKVILDRTPGVFLSGMDVKMVPATALPGGSPAWKLRGGGGRFGGWQIRRFHPGDPCLGRAGIRVGDIVVGVGDQALRTPGDLVKVWQTLRKAPRIVIRLYRNDEPLVFVVKIKD